MADDIQCSFCVLLCNIIALSQSKHPANGFWLKEFGCERKVACNGPGFNAVERCGWLTQQSSRCAVNFLHIIYPCFSGSVRLGCVYCDLRVLRVQICRNESLLKREDNKNLHRPPQIKPAGSYLWHGEQWVSWFLPILPRLG